MAFVCIFATLMLVYYLSPKLVVFVFRLATDRRMKAEILLETFGIPVTFGLAIAFLIMVPEDDINIFAVVGCFLGSLVRVLWNDQKYLATIKIDHHNVYVEYLSPLGKMKALEFSLQEIANVEMEKGNLFTGSAGTVKFKLKEGWIKFHVVNSELRTVIGKHLDHLKAVLIENGIAPAALS